MRAIFTSAVLGAVLGVLGMAGTAQATVVYVRADVAASGAGTTWATAYKTLQEALTAAAANAAITEVWIKAGTYYPTAYPTGSTGGATTRDYAFGLKSGLALYGGFAGTETAVAQRVAGNTTTLSGDIGTVGSTADNCYHVVVAANVTNTAVLDGVTVTLGNANGTTNGAGALSRANGGGMYLSGAQARVTSCLFVANAAVANGGGMYTNNASPTVTGCTFSANSVKTSGSYTQGGGVAIQNTSAPTFSACTFSGNNGTGGTTASTIAVGGALYNGSGCTTTLTDCDLLNNFTAAFNGGGAICNDGTLTATNCLFANNSAGAVAAGSAGTGGALQSGSEAGFTAAVATLTNCLFVGNQANGTDDDGGGIICVYVGAVTLRNCTGWNNTTASTSHPTANSIATIAGSVTVVNSILWGAAAQVFNAGTTAITYSDMKGGYTGTGNVGADPSFTNPAAPAGADGLWGTADDGLTLKSCSPALNAGTTPSPAIPTDYLGSARVGAYDMGAYEYQGAATLPTLAAATTAYTTTQLTTTTYGDCDNVIATVASAGAAPVGGSTTATVYVRPTVPPGNARPYVRRTHDIRPATNPNAATATIMLYYTQAVFTDYNANRGSQAALPLDAADAAGNKANLRINQQHGTSTTGAPGTYTGYTGTGAASVVITPTSVTYNATLARWEVTFPVTGFSGFFASTNTVAIPLPVQLVAFTAQAAGPAAVRLAWATASELNSARFEVERSPDGVAFAKIGEVAAAGSSPTARTYGLLDAAAPTGQLYYRLRQVDQDGTAAYSPVQAVTLRGSLGLVLAPNPTRAQATASGLTAGAGVEVLDLLGRPVLRIQADEAGQAAMALPAGLTPGLYLVRSGRQAARLVVE